MPYRPEGALTPVAFGKRKRERLPLAPLIADFDAKVSIFLEKAFLFEEKSVTLWHIFSKTDENETFFPASRGIVHNGSGCFGQRPDRLSRLPHDRACRHHPHGTVLLADSQQETQREADGLPLACSNLQGRPQSRKRPALGQPTHQFRRERSRSLSRPTTALSEPHLLASGSMAQHGRAPRKSRTELPDRHQAVRR